MSFRRRDGTGRSTRRLRLLADSYECLADRLDRMRRD